MRKAIDLFFFLVLFFQVYGANYNCDNCNQLLGLLNTTNTVMLTPPLYLMDSNQIPIIIYSVYGQDQDSNTLIMLKCTDPSCKSTTYKAFYTFSTGGSQDVFLSGYENSSHSLIQLLVPCWKIIPSSLL